MEENFYMLQFLICSTYQTSHILKFWKDNVQWISARRIKSTDTSVKEVQQIVLEKTAFKNQRRSLVSSFWFSRPSKLQIQAARHIQSKISFRIKNCQFRYPKKESSQCKLNLHTGSVKYMWQFFFCIFQQLWLGSQEIFQLFRSKTSCTEKAVDCTTFINLKKKIVSLKSELKIKKSRNQWQILHFSTYQGYMAARIILFSQQIFQKKRNQKTKFWKMKPLTFLRKLSRTDH